MTEMDYWLAFSVANGIGPKKFQILLQTFGSAEKAWKAGGQEIIDVLKPALGKNFLTFRESFEPQKYKQKIEKNNAWIVMLQDKEYSKRLREVENAPFVLFGKGNKEILNQVFDSEVAQAREVQDDGNIAGSTPGVDARMIGVVGTRKVTSYGRQVTEMITEDLVQAGCVIVSGLALGVDAIAHQTTIRNGGKTIAVLGCGVDCCYPSTNEGIYQEILKSGGAIISEYPLSMKPSVGSFPSRNRIIAGMSEAVVVTEGAEDSGSLITAVDALDLGRKVFAIPGPITSQLSNGPMRLIRKGAVLVTSGEEILQEIGLKGDKGEGGEGRVIRKGETKEEQVIIDLLQNESLGFDDLVKKSKVSASTLGGLLSLMELKGYIVSSPDGKVGLVR